MTVDIGTLIVLGETYTDLDLEDAERLALAMAERSAARQGLVLVGTWRSRIFHAQSRITGPDLDLTRPSVAHVWPAIPVDPFKRGCSRG